MSRDDDKTVDLKIPKTGKHVILAEGEAAIVFRSQDGKIEIVAHDDTSIAARAARVVLNALAPAKVCTCTNQETAHESNPQGHAVGCPFWGTDVPNTKGLG